MYPGDPGPGDPPEYSKSWSIFCAITFLFNSILNKLLWLQYRGTRRILHKVGSLKLLLKCNSPQFFFFLIQTNFSELHLLKKGELKVCLGWFYFQIFTRKWWWWYLTLEILLTHLIERNDVFHSNFSLAWYYISENRLNIQFPLISL